MPKTRKKAPSTSEPWPQGKPLWQTPPPTDVPGAWFDQAAVDKVVSALRALRHTKGKWAGLSLEPEPWQVEYVIGPIFGWKHPDGTRIVREAWVELPRKNGKSTLSSGLALVLLAADDEAGAEVYAAAASEKQARIVFNASRDMARAAPLLKGKLVLGAASIFAPSNNSVYRVLSKVAETAHGLNVSGAVVDEVHVHKKRDLIDAIATGTGAREQPLVIYITTSDDGTPGTIYDEKHEYIIQLAKRIVSDPTTYGVIWAAGEKDDPFAESTWRKANPGIDVTVKLEYLKKEAARARAIPAYFATFARLSLNRRIRSVARMLNLSDWDATAGLVVPRKLAGRTCYGGLDLASSIDIAAFELVFPMPDGTFQVLSHFWMPAAQINARREAKDKVPYRTWVRQGLITATPGNVIDYEAIRKKIIELADTYDIQEIGYDRWGAVQLSQQLTDEAITVVPIGQGMASMSPPTKEFIRLVMEKKLIHGGHPVLRWMSDNAAAKTDAAENMKPEKSESTGRIDGVVALIMAIDRATRNAPSVYEERGLQSV